MSVHSADYCIETMSLTGVALTMKFREWVIYEFISYCDTAGSDIDLAMLGKIGGEYCKTSLEDLPKSRKVSPPGVKVKKKKKKKEVVDPDNFKCMPEVVEGKCMARTFTDGWGTQCTRNTCAGSEDYCTRHMNSASNCKDKSQPYPALGRIDKPRCTSRFDNGKDVIWRFYKGGAEEICEDGEICEGVGVGDGADLSLSDDTESEKMTGEGLNIDSVVSSLDSQNMVKPSDGVVDEVSPDEKDSAPAPLVVKPHTKESPVVESDKVVSVVMGDLCSQVEEEEVAKPHTKESLVVEPDKVVSAVMDDLCSQVEEEVTKSHAEEEPVDVELMEDTVDKPFPKVGLYQGVKYMFGEENLENGTHPVMDKDTKKVGEFSDDEVILNYDYKETHEWGITDPEQEDVVWL